MLETLSDCLELARETARKNGYLLRENAFDIFIFGGVSYGQTLSSSEELITKKGNVARKCLQLKIHRPGIGEPNAGKYDAICYVL